MAVVKSSFELAFFLEDGCLMFSVVHSKWSVREVSQREYQSGIVTGSFVYLFLRRLLQHPFMKGPCSIREVRDSPMYLRETCKTPGGKHNGKLG